MSRLDTKLRRAIPTGTMLCFPPQLTRAELAKELDRLIPKLTGDCIDTIMSKDTASGKLTILQSDCPLTPGFMANTRSFVTWLDQYVERLESKQ